MNESTAAAAAAHSAQPCEASQGDLRFSEENMAELDRVRKRYPTNLAALLPALHLAQKQFGWISLPVMRYVAEVLDLSPMQVYSTVTFYTMFHKEPPGRFHLQVCTNIACSLRGAEGLMAQVVDRLGAGPGERTADGLFSIEEVECLASCGTAPAMRVNDDYHECMDEKKLAQLLDGLVRAAEADGGETA